MPELPEVETTARLLRPRLVGQVVRAVDLRWPRTLARPSLRRFERETCGRAIRSVGRRGKFVVLGFDAGEVLVHLRMSGRLLVVSGDAESDERWLRLRWHLASGDRLEFVDPRKFGRVYGVAHRDEIVSDLGPEPLAEEFTAEAFAERVRGRRRALKPLLLDQAFVAGLGNIYVDESLHRARLHPARSASGLSRAEIERLVASIRAILGEAIEREGSSFDGFYRTPEGRPGAYQEQFLVYGRDGRPCRTCGTPIRRIVQGQRGTHVCPRCQPTPRRRSRLKRS